MSDQANGLPDIESIKISSRRNLKDGAVTGNYQADLGAVISLLNGALATELVCVLRYRAH